MGMFDLGIGGLFKGFNSFMHPEKGYKKAQKELDKYYNQSQGYYQPYVNQGQEAYGSLNNAMQSLMNPSELYDQFMGSYAPSDQAMMRAQEARNSGLNAASSMGLMGSTPALTAIQRGTSQIMADDEQRYLDRLMNSYLSGAQIAQGIYGTGATAGMNMGQNASQMGQNSAQMAYGAQNAPGQMFNDLLKTAVYAGTGGMGGSLGGGGGGWSTTGGR